MRQHRPTSRRTRRLPRRTEQSRRMCSSMAWKSWSRAATASLLAYVARLEGQPWQVYWGKTVLSADYPKVVVALTLYTLSLDGPGWWCKGPRRRTLCTRGYWSDWWRCGWQQARRRRCWAIPRVRLRVSAAGAASAGARPATRRALVLESVIISDTNRSAIISGEHIMLGGKIGQARLVKVSEAAVVLLDGRFPPHAETVPGCAQARRRSEQDEKQRTSREQPGRGRTGRWGLDETHTPQRMAAGAGRRLLAAAGQART